MKGIVYKEPFHVELEEVPDPRIDAPTDAVIRITTSNICGSDLHMYEGRTDVRPGTVLGHENTGVVMETGSAVTRLQSGNRVSVPFNIACGTCANCERGLTGYCLRANPGFAGAAYGYADMGPYPGGQAEYLRVPFADFNCLLLPDGTEHEQDFALLSDVFPTGYHGVELSGMQPGDSVVVFGAGPVGLLAAYSAVLRGASLVMIVDRVPSRLALAERIGVVPINPDTADVAEHVLELTGGRGAACGVDAVGYQAHDADGTEEPQGVLNDLVSCVRATGGIGVVGVYVPQDPKAASPLARGGRVPFDIGLFFQRGQRMGTGQCNVKAYNRRLRDLIVQGNATPSFLVSHELPLTVAPGAYSHFDRRDEGWTKILLHPAAA